MFNGRMLLVYAHNTLINMAGVAAAVGTAIGGLANGLFNYSAARSANYANANLNEENRAWQEKMFNKSLAWDDYLSQVERMKRAGLNPSFLFNNGIGAPSGASAPSAPATHSAMPAAFQMDISTPAQMLFQSKTLENETRKTDAEIDNIVANSESLKIANQHLDEKINLDLRKLEDEHGLSQQEIEAKKVQIEETKAHTLQLYQDAERLGYYSNLIKQQIVTERLNQHNLSVVIDKAVKMMPFEIEHLKSQYNLNYTEATVALETIDKIKAEVSNLVKQGEKLDADIVSTLLDNSVKDVKSRNEIGAEYFKGASPVMNAIISSSSGLIQGIASSLNAWSVGLSTDKSKGDYYNIVDNQRNIFRK